MTYAAAFFVVVCFALALRRLAVVSIARAALDTGRRAAGTIRCAALSDREKEQAARAASLTLARSFGSIAGRTALAAAASVAPLLALELAGVVRASAVNDLLTSWNGVLLAVPAMPLAFLGRPRS